MLIGLVSAQENTTVPPALIKEQVKCIFENSNEMQKCYTDDGKFGCSGTGTCVTDVYDDNGKKLTWKSSCEGYAYTVVDGNDEYAEFKCATVTTSANTQNNVPAVSGNTQIVKEQVKCIFDNSNEMQKCYTDDGKFGCSGTGTCVMDVDGKKGEKLTWKSSCGEYAYTITDGDNDYAEFKCISASNVTEETISGKGFRYAYWQCYDGAEEKQGSESSCKSAETWQSYAKKFCDGHCYKDESKCGVNSFSVTENCYFDAAEKPFISSVNEEENSLSITGTGEKVLICKDSCPLDGKCYPFGYRKSGNFCSDQGAFVEQLKGDLACDNNFECSSNLCIDSQCVSQGLFKKIMDWFSNIFGGK